MNKRIYTLVDKIESQLSITATLLAELHTELGLPVGGNQVATLTGGVWVAYYHDRSAIKPFETELDARRYATEHHMEVLFLEWGEHL